eukprot:TRINITY_DN12140_c0_g1_i2.p1 TRINITY_DN12140_c0_g1~~TRINITY_DN12140_c0_g1_i2.p1  ORF type:complete len:207 (+),score=31.15 TRINITY_DN12140_c0_g1_i2:30-623(+)
MPPSLRLASGAPMHVYVLPTHCVAEVRGLIAEILGHPLENVRLAFDEVVKEDTDVIGADGEFTVLIVDPFAWHPRGKYLHMGKDVSSVVEEDYTSRFGSEHKLIVHFVDKTSVCYGTWRGNLQGNALGGQVKCTEVLERIKEWSFVPHKIEARWSGGRSVTIEWVPLEDPDEWIAFSRNTSCRMTEGEQRKAKLNIR